MLPEPTIPKRRAASPAPQPWVMTPLFCVPDEDADEDDPAPVPVPGRRTSRPPGRGRRATQRGPASPRGSGGRAKRDGAPEPPDLLAVTAQRLRLALARSFLRYGIPGDREAAVHAAMNVIEPVLQARDTEILRLRRLMPAKRPAR
jgi:hypothetical protein